MKKFYKILFLMISFSLFFQALQPVQCQIPYFLLGFDQFYDVNPDLSGCKEGTLKDAEKQKVLQSVNYIRKIHGLKPVIYNYSLDQQVAKTALIMTANEALNHNPPQGWKCWSQDGFNGAQKTNLFISYSYQTFNPTEYSVTNWMIDLNVSECGHRRWLIDPFLKYIAIGRADGVSTVYPQLNVTGMAIYVISDDKQSLSDWSGDFAAYPYQDYPKAYFYNSKNEHWYFSFTAIFDKVNYNNNNKVSFANATIEIKDENNNAVSVTEVVNRNDWYGVPNCLTWNIPGFQPDRKYNVTIKNVKYNTQTKDFSYWFNVTDNVTPDVPSAPILALPANNTQDADLNPVLSWNSSQFAERYNCQVALDNTFKTGLQEYKNLTGTQQQLNNLNELTTYYWRVNAANSAGTSSWSSFWSFKTKSVPIATPSLVFPADGATKISSKTKFRWNFVTGAGSFAFQVANQSDFASFSIVYENKSVYDTLVQIPDGILPAAAKHYWRVQAKGVSTSSQWTTPREFWSENPSVVSGNEIPNELPDLEIYPNPATSKLSVYLKINNPDDFSLDIINPLGYKTNIITEKRLETGSFAITEDLSGFSSGIYFIQLKCKNFNLIQKLIIMRN